MFLGVWPKTRDPGSAAGSLPPDTGTSCAWVDAGALADAMALPVRLTATKVAVATNPSPIDLNEPERRLRLMLFNSPCSKSALCQLRLPVLARACRRAHAQTTNVQQKCEEFRLAS